MAERFLGFLGVEGGTGTNEMKTERIQVRRRKLKNNMYFPKSCTMGDESIVKLEADFAISIELKRAAVANPRPSLLDLDICLASRCSNIWC